MATLTGSAMANPTFCNSGATTAWTGGSGNWNNQSSWTAGIPTSSCSAVINGNVSVTLTTTPNPNGQTDPGTGVVGLTLSGGATLTVEGEASDTAGDWVNYTTLQIGSGGLAIGSGSTLDLVSTDNYDTGQTLGGSPGGGAYIQIEDGPVSFTNDGTINASTTDASYQDYMQFGADMSDPGSINVQSGTLNLDGTNSPMVVNNTGTFTVDSGATAVMNAGDGSAFINDGTFANQGTTTVSSSGSMYWGQNGGSETGNPVELEVGEGLRDSAGAGSFDFTNCAGGFLSGTIPAGQTVTVTGGCSGTTAYLGTRSSTSTVVNDGTLVLNAPSGGSDAILAGGELDNHGTLESTVGGAGLANQLLVPLVNESGATVNVAGGELEQTAGTATSNAGAVNLDPGATWLVQGGAFTNTGTLAPQISGASSVGSVNLTAGSVFTAGGALAPTLESGYAPASGTEFPFITLNGGSVTGTFGSVASGFSADYSHETVSSGTPYVGVIYGTSSGPGESSGSQLSAHAHEVTGNAAAIKLTLVCSSGSAACGAYKVSGTVTEHLKRGKLTAVTARAKKPVKTATTKVVTVLSASGSLASSKSATLELKLNRAGAKLLKQFGRLRVEVTVTDGGKQVSQTVVTVTKAKVNVKKR